MRNAHYLDVDGTVAYVEEAGSGQPVLCLHTAGQSGVQWRHVVDDLATQFRVVVPDLPGHGRSEPAAGPPVRDLAVYARWCETLIETMGLDRPLVVGCSIGGKIALDMAARSGAHLMGVVALAADAGNTSVDVRALSRELEDAASPARSDRTELGTLASVGRTVPPDRARLIAAMHRREDPLVSTSDLIGWADHDIDDALGGIVCPTHLVVGADDPWMIADDVRAAAARIPGARFTLLDGVGHYPMEEIDGFADVLRAWFVELAPPQKTEMVGS